MTSIVHSSKIKDRQPAGVPSGGQFTSVAHPETGVTLAPSVPAAGSGRARAPQDRTNDSESVGAIFRPGREMPDHLSFSSASGYSFCPAAWALERLDGHRKDNPAAAKPRLVGSASHAVLDKVAVGQTVEDALAEVTADPAYDGLEAEITSMVDRCVRWEPASPTRSTLRETEVHIEAEIEGYKLVGEIDCVELDDDGVVVISDYKTGRTPSPVNSSDLDDDPANLTEPIYNAGVTRQAVLYAEMAEATGRHVGRVRMIYPASEVVVQVDLDSERGQLLRTEARRFVEYEGGRISHSIRTGVFPTKPTPNKCARCDVAEHCPAANQST